jgi:Ser/Thr protein kinase RdoA (MazF antagonist)
MNTNFEEMFGEVVGNGAQATVYAKGDFAVKLYREGYPKVNVFTEAYMMAHLEQIHFPSPKVYEILFVNERYGIRMDRVKGKMLGEGCGDLSRWDSVLDALVDLQYRLQKYDMAFASNLKTRFRDDLKRNDKLSPDLKQELFKELDKLPDGQALCHCDFHANNVFFDGTEYTIIDLLQISKGDPAADVACSYVAYNFFNQDIAELYLNKYCNKSGISRKDVQKWLRVYAGTLLGQVPEQFTPILERFLAGDEA